GKEKIFHMPDRCPVCGSEVVKLEGEVAYRCNNISCPAQVKERIQHFVSRDAMDIDGIGVALIEQLVDQKLIDSFADLYYLSKEDLLSLERMAEKSSENVLEAITESKDRPLSNLIYGLGIRHVGSYASKLLAQKINHLLDLQQISLEELTGIREIGTKMAESIVTFFQNKENLKVIQRLKDAGINLRSVKKENENRLLTGTQFVLTGTLEHFTREEAKKIIEQMGGRVTSDVTGKTDYLVLGKEPGQKYQRAKAMNIKVIEEKELIEMLKRK
ncbi:MAG: NAD-dependent DNA ligase LigA, partial [Candidatus Aminicenantes bacterium]|nr:NAD-dependent DNA ligase LigA [Candidatus Aminicenantes bacterium]